MMFSIICLFISSMAFGQYVELNMEQYGVSFMVPDDFEVTENDESFKGNNEFLHLGIFPFHDENVNFDDLAEATIEVAEGMEYDVVSDVGIMELSGLIGYYVDCRKDDVNAFVMTLLNPETSTNLIVVIIYADDMFDQAVDIGASFYVSE